MNSEIRQKTGVCVFFMKLVINVKRKIDTYLEGYGVKKVMLKGKELAEKERGERESK